MRQRQCGRISGGVNGAIHSVMWADKRWRENNNKWRRNIKSKVYKIRERTNSSNPSNPPHSAHTRHSTESWCKHTVGGQSETDHHHFTNWHHFTPHQQRQQQRRQLKFEEKKTRDKSHREYIEWHWDQDIRGTTTPSLCPQNNESYSCIHRVSERERESQWAPHPFNGRHSASNHHSNHDPDWIHRPLHNAHCHRDCHRDCHRVCHRDWYILQSVPIYCPPSTANKTNV